MKQVMAMWAWIVAAIAKTLGLAPKDKRARRFRGVAWVESGQDPAKELATKKLVLIGPRERPKWLKFSCPCGCKETLALNLMASHSPRWSVTIENDGTLSVHPSVDATRCKSHFWIRGNRIDWV